MKEKLRLQQIEATLSANWESFKMWQNQNHATQTFDMHQDAAQVFTPKRILELSEDPNNVHALLTERSSHFIGVVISERLPRALTDIERFNKWIEGHKTQITMLPSSQEDSPEGVDYKHIRHQKLLESGKLTFNDKIYIHYVADIPDGYPGVVFTRNYGDRKELQRKGIGSSFYERLETVLRELEFKYLVGDVISPHAEFFKRQRIPYLDLSNVVKMELPLDLRNRSSSRNIMVKVL